jgi:acyl-homoserine lactone acylase PvdQ
MRNPRQGPPVSRVLRPWVLCLLCAVTGCRAAPPPPPLVAQVTGTMTIDGVAAPVRVVRDTWGVPHIYAQNADDLFFAQGFVQAQDRLFQMDLWRRSAQGRLSEVLGPNFIERDAMTRRMQYRGDLAADWNSYGPDTNAIARAFVRGVNAWVRLARDRPPEEFVLAGWKPEEWSADDLLNRTEALTASGDALDEVFRARLVAAVGLARARLLLPGDRGLDGPASVDPGVVPDLVAEAIRRAGTPPFFLGLAARVTSGTVRLPPPGVGSDTAQASSVVATRSIATTFPSPSPRYLVHLNAPGWNVIGATAPWRPGVAAGHNDRISWTAEPFDADTQDIVVEKLNPADDRQVEDGGRWVNIETSKSWIAVRGRKTPVDFDRMTTRHGVVVTSDREGHRAFALRWSGAEPGGASELAALAADRASSWATFQDALGRWKMPARRMTYVDADGVRGSAVAALVPIRRGWSGGLPVAGWTGATEWSGWTAPETKATPQLPAAVLTAKTLLESMRLHPDRADALLQQLTSSRSSRDPLTSQRAAIVDALADALRDRERSADGPVLFAHPLAVTDAARRRFNVIVASPAKAVVDAFAIACDPADWDRSTAIAAPGQSGSPDSAHYADLAKVWSEGAAIPLAFTESAVKAHAEATLLLTPK